MAPTVSSHKRQRTTTFNNLTKLKAEIDNSFKHQHKVQAIEKADQLQYLYDTVSNCVVKLQQKLEKYDAAIESFQLFLESEQNEVASNELDKVLLTENDEIEIYRNQLVEMQTHLNTIDKKLNKLEAKTEPITPVQTAMSSQQIIDAMKASMAELLLTQQQNKNAAETNTSKTKVQIPKLIIKPFSGNLLEWTGFWSQFSSAIDSRKDFDPIEKFNFLRSHLTGTPLKDVDAYSFTPENYPIVVAFLKERFGRDNKIKDAHFQALHTLLPTKSDSASLTVFYDTLERHLRTLEGLGQDVDHYSLVSVINAKLPEDVRCEMERLKPCSQDWSVSLLREHLKEVVLMKENLCLPSEQSVHPNPTSFESSGAHPKNSSSNRNPRPTGQSLVNFEKKPQGSRPNCVFCEKSHWMDECPSFTDSMARIKQLKTLNRCTICLSTSHSTKQCRNTRTCFHCAKTGHHRSLCFKKFKSPQKPKSEVPPKGGPKSGLFSDNSPLEDTPDISVKAGEKFLNFPTEAVLAHGESILMQTGIIPVSNPKGSKYATSMATTIFDTGSTETYVVFDFARELQLELGNEELKQIATFGQTKVTTQKVYTTVLSVQLKDGSRKKITAKVIPRISAPTYRVPYGNILPKDVILNIRKYTLADSIPIKPECRAYQLLIGQDYYYDFMLKDRKEIPSCPGLHLQNTRIGWIVAGRIKDDISLEQPIPNFFVHSYLKSKQPDASFLVVQDSVRTAPEMKRFWDVETLGIEPPSDQTDHEEAVQQFNDTVKIVDDRVEVTWPKKLCNPDLPDNYSLALHRLESQCKRFSQRPALMQKCDEIIQNQVELGIIEPVNSDTVEGPLKHYIPHHVVETPDKLTTKARMVFDASAKKNKDSLSLNDCLYSGPVDILIQDLPGLLIRFRLSPIAIIADIEKAFLNISLQIPDRDVTRFFWFKDPTKPSVTNNIQVYRFCRVPFGVNSSPFLLASTVNYILEMHGSPVALQLRDDIYVDNVITGAKDEDSAIKLYEESQTIFQKVKLNLREWSSNSEKFLSQLPTHHRADGAVQKVLGILWNTITDTISIPPIDKKDFTQIATKRTVLQALASVYDPMGYFSPVTLMAKIFLCSLWVDKYDWDFPLPADKLAIWNTIFDNIREISNVTFPRYLGHSPLSGATFQLICFCDASGSSYATTVYLRSVLGTTCLVDLQFSKTRIAPPKKKKTWTIPRLELMAAVIGHRSLNSVEKWLHLTISSKTLFSDSQCVLHWIRSTKPLSVFVENRVREIRTAENTTFRYVHTTSNPADFATRGRTVSELEDSIWWKGPPWLKLPEDQWPTWDVQSFDQSTLDAIDAESRKTPSVMYDVGLLVGERTVQREMSTPFEIDRLRFSSLSKLYRVTAYCRRFILRCLKNSSWRTKLHSRFHLTIDEPFLTTQELSDAQLLWDSAIQQHWYPDTISSMKSGDKPNQLTTQLGLKFDHQGLIRCYGRFENADLHTQAAIQPKLYPAKDHLTKLLVEYFHKEALHSGVSQTLATIRQQYWIPQGRSRIRSILTDCRVCRRIMGGPYKLPVMAPWPKERMNQSPPFTVTGLDYFGPLFIVDDQKTEQKVWVCLFTCVATRAVHLEMINDMSTDEFLRCFRRFISFRGKPQQIISDNATQFKLAKTTLEKAWINVVDDPEVQSYIANQGIRWKFIIQFAPWTGGFYERMVGIAKSSLKKSIGTLRLTASQLNTFLAESQAIVNSRPLVYLDDDVNSEGVLSPNHFLVLNPKVGIPILSQDTDDGDPDFNLIPESSAESLIRLWKTGQKHLERFWTIWKNSYLLSLRERYKHTVSQGRIQSTDTIKSGDIVLIKDNLPRGAWKLGRVKSLIVSNDGAVRAANVMLPSRRTLSRPINLLYPIECPIDLSISDTPPDEPDNLSPMQRCCNTGMSDLPSSNSTPDTKQSSVDEPMTEQSTTVPIVNTRPQRSAAVRGREIVAGWIKDMVGLVITDVPRIIDGHR